MTFSCAQSKPQSSTSPYGDIDKQIWDSETSIVFVAYGNVQDTASSKQFCSIKESASLTEDEIMMPFLWRS